MSGYFLVPEKSGYTQGVAEWMLTSIPKEEMALKGY